MPRTRTEAARPIAEHFIPAKRMAVGTAASISQLVSVILQQRPLFALRPGAGAEAMRLIQRAQNASFDAQQCLDEAHGILADIREDLKISPYAFGADDTPPNRPPSGELLDGKVVRPQLQSVG